MDQQQKLIETLSVVFQDLDCFISQKISQNLIHAIFRIKKQARRHRNSQTGSVYRKSNSSSSQNNYFTRKSQIQAKNQAFSYGRQIRARFDLAKGAQNLTNIRRSDIYSKPTTQRLSNKNEHLSNRQYQPSFFNSPQSHTIQNSPRVHIVPKLVGLKSSEQILDIQQPLITDKLNRTSFRNYQQSIAEIQEDDDQFQDVMLNRLVKIQQRVSKMLRQKISAKLAVAKSRVSDNYRLQIPNSRVLQNAGSTGNIIYSNRLRNTEFYKHNGPKYNKSTAMMSPKHQTFENSKSNSMYPSSKKTQKYNNINSQLPAAMQNYMTNKHPYGPDRTNISTNYQPQTFVHHPQNQMDQLPQHQMMNKNKILGHYRQSQDTLVGSDILDRVNVLRNKHRDLSHNTIDYERIRNEPVHGPNSIKYIPFTKMSGVEQLQQKTQRQVPHRAHQQQERSNIAIKNVLKYQHSQEERYSEQIPDNYSQSHKKPTKRQQQLKSRSTKNSAVHVNSQQKRLQNSDIKAYTQYASYLQDSNRQLSVSSQRNMYQEIKELREMVKVYGASNRQLLNSDNEKKGLSRQNPIYDQRHHQDTRRLRYQDSSNRKNVCYNKNNGHQQTQQLANQGQHPQERVSRVTKPSQNFRQQSQIASGQCDSSRVQSIQFVEYPYQQEQTSHVENQPAHLTKQGQRQQPSRNYQQPTVYHKKLRELKGNSVLWDSSVQQVKRGSQCQNPQRFMNSFKSIPYNREQISSRHLVQQQKQKSVEYVIEQSNSYLRSFSNRSSNFD